ncbi:hypothetical protein BSP75_00280 [Aeromonas sp. YN13HZO-058]|uniref:acyltransferase family protein n=1 Tax=Aeromonas sp. YN13HZO-058 TaxID=1921564 RepID=UPI000946F902|nr:acyltransferase [Aeromonas sp. YN13HZO-058]OLF23659.1 hypothetical protein BSP75_00280 [Aeromonas sp. YN13HZO-058]
MKNLNNKQSREDSRIYFLDYLRVFAFLSVLIAHRYYEQLALFANNMDVHITLRLMVSMLSPFIEFGGAGVIVFFFISGYIITCVAMREDFNVFIVRRFFRIYPLYIVAVIIEMMLNHIFKGEPIPSLSIILPRIALLGDFWGTPYSLNNVEWTLRIEIYFYIVIALMLKLGLFGYTKVLPIVYAIIILLIQYLEPFPLAYGWSNGYASMFLPFLFVGSCVYLWEKGLSNKYIIFALSVYVWLSYLITMPSINNRLQNTHFLTVAIILFLICWAFRKNFKNITWLVFLSELTYSIYIFHNWMMQYFMDFGGFMGLSILQSNIFSLCSLLAFCSIFHFCVEKKFINIGARITMKIKGDIER